VSAQESTRTAARLVHVTTVPMSFTFLRRQVGYMRERGLDVAAVSSPGPEASRFAEAEGVRVYAVDMPRRITLGQDLRAICGLLGVLRKERPDIVHAHTPKGGLLGMISATLAGVGARVYHMRGLPLMTARGPRRALLWLTEWVACALAHRVICVSHSLRDVALEKGITRPDKIRVLLGGSGNGVDASGRFDPRSLDSDARARTRARFGIPEDAIVIGFVGRLVRDKGICELTEAWSRLRAAHPQAHLLVVGPFEPQDPVSSDVERALREDPRVHLAGEDWNTPPLYAAMDVVALPTYREGFPNVPLEAAAMGLPVVATRVPGCVDAVADDTTGVLVPPRDAAALEGALRAYVADEVLRRRHGAAGRARVLREFRQEALWEALHAEYAALLARRGRAPTHEAAVPSTALR
jgi:glycosyltransferase involved in cell wall biosynthesis